MSGITRHPYFILLAFALLAGLPRTEVMAQQSTGRSAEPQSAKWFVLRNGRTGYCQTARLISVGGDYRSRSSLKAGGPYGTHEEALRQKEILEAGSICTKA